MFLNRLLLITDKMKEMKKLSSGLVAVAAIIILTSLSSCTKENLNPLVLDHSVPDVKFVDYQVGAIQDLGPVTGDVRLMYVTFEKKGLVRDSGNDLTLGVPDKFTVEFYTTSDGYIPSGSYIYSASGVKSNFTFGNGHLVLAGAEAGSETEIHEVSDGSISVTFEEDHYSFNLSMKLHSGYDFSANFGGRMTYEDLPLK
jgi:hypothetical protein